MLNCYIALRAKYQKNKKFLTKAELKEMISEAKAMVRNPKATLIDIDGLSDLIVDIECLVDTMENIDTEVKRKQLEREVVTGRPLSQNDAFSLNIESLNTETLLHDLRLDATMQVYLLTGKNKSRTAKILGVSLRGLRDTFRKYNLS